MEMHQLRYVVAVARAGNFSRAAELCHVAQPSLSQQIQKLEDELGERLFDRVRREARLTPCGEAFLSRAVHILQEVDAAKREAAETTIGLRGRLTFGVLPTLAPYLLPQALASFTAKYRGVELVVQEDTTERLLNQLMAYELDFAIVSPPLSEARMAIKPLLTEELFLAVPPAHRLANKSRVTVADLAGERFILMKEGHCLGDQVLDFCDRRDLVPTISFRSAQLETIQSLIVGGLGISLIPAMATRRQGAGAPVYRSLQPPRPKRQIVAVWPEKRTLTRAASEFLSLLTQGAGK